MSSPDAKEKAAMAAVSYIVPLLISVIQKKRVAVIGVGTGSTVSLVMAALPQAFREHKIDIQSSLICISTSFQSQELIIQAGLRLGHLVQYPELDLAFDGADEVDASGSFLIKGGGGAHLLEKIVAYSSKKFIVVVDASKVSGHHTLGDKWTRGIPLSVLPEAVEMVRLRLAQLGYAATLRCGSGKMGPVVSDQGHMIMDVKRADHLPFRDVSALCSTLSAMPGVLEHGLFVHMASTVIVGSNEQDPMIMDCLLPTQ